MKINYFVSFFIFAITYCCSVHLSAQQSNNMVYVKGNEKINSFYVDKHEVTVGDFKKFVEATGYVTVAERNGGSYHIDLENPNQYKIKEGYFWDYQYYIDGFKGIENHVNVSMLPVGNMCPADAAAYAKWAGKRLLTYEEWLYAANGGKEENDFKYSGSNKAKEVAWFDRNSGEVPHEVGTLKPNQLGIYDMSGNIHEIVEYKSDESKMLYRLMGGFFGNDLEYLKFEMYFTLLRDDIPFPRIGFRCAKDVEQ